MKSEISNIQDTFILFLKNNKYNFFSNINKDIELIKNFYNIPFKKNNLKILEIEENLLNEYCNNFKEYFKANNDLDKTKYLCNCLITQPESYVFPYTTASLTNKIDTYDRNESCFNLLKYLNQDFELISIIELLSVIENLVDLSFNQKSKYLIRALINLSKVVSFFKIREHQDILIIIKSYLQFLKSNSLDKFIKLDIIKILYSLINNFFDCKLKRFCEQENKDEKELINYIFNKTNMNIEVYKSTINNPNKMFEIINELYHSHKDVNKHKIAVKNLQIMANELLWFFIDNFKEKVSGINFELYNVVTTLQDINIKKLMIKIQDK